MRSWAEINTAALKHNLAQVKALAPNSKIVAMVKTNAYGHGFLGCAKALAGADYFGVATLEEAITLRNHQINSPILLMPGFQTQEELELLQQHNIDSVVYDPFQLDLLKKAKRPVNVWLKFETGMHRLGFAPELAQTAISQALAMPHVKVAALMTHFACADIQDSSMSKAQMQAFEKIVASHKLALSVSNSSAILRYPQWNYDYIRPGMMLYGVSPLAGGKAEDHGILPVMTLKTHIIRLMDLQIGDSVGYGAEWKAQRPSKIAVLAIGYGDGYPRQAQASVALLHGKKVPVAGRTSMDYLTIDVTDVHNASIHDEVTLWGEGLPIEEVAGQLQTSPYALLSNLSARIKRIS
ncbi:MAG: alanine racemase [Gammaproteobacteria bacterium]|jgi:alanine racemase|nr:alanine racemase [Gammaproteobacteria bacterium]